MKRILPFLLVIASALCVGCGLGGGDSSEPALLAVFKEELAELKAQESGSYSDYMANREKGFKRRQERVNALIVKINSRFDGMAESEKQSYQRQWREAFQPVVEEIYTRTRAMVVRETRELTPAEMARIKDLSVRHKALEKETPQATLKPRFFILPEEPKETL